MVKKLLITGANGMVGRNILAHSSAQNWEILAPSSAELDLTDQMAVQEFYRAEKKGLRV